MSVGNLKTEGNKGNNMPFQLRLLQIMGAILGNANSTSNTPHAVSATGTGSVSVPVKNITFQNAGGANGTVTINGTVITLAAGKSLSFDAGGQGNTFPTAMFSYNGTGTTLLITYTT